MKVGVFLPQGWRMDLADVHGPVEKYETMSRCAVEAEKAGFDGVFLYDHFQTVPEPAHEAVFECWTAMAALARDTKTIRLGQMVTCNSYRPPSLLAKMASCVDVMSHGRLILGIGAGWYQHEYEAYGYEYPDTPERLRMLRESLQVIKSMWTEREASFDGRHYRLRGAINEPRPVQVPHPPIWIGGAGERVTLKLVAQYGDACNLRADLDTVRHKLDVLREHCAAVGRDYDSILKTAEFYAIVGDRKEVDRVVRDTARRVGRNAAFVRHEWQEFVGDAANIASVMREYAGAGIDYFLVNLPNAAEGGVFERFAAEVFPLLDQPARSRASRAIES